VEAPGMGRRGGRRGLGGQYKFQTVQNIQILVFTVLPLFDRKIALTVFMECYGF
jgi:hypothetical protein